MDNPNGQLVTKVYHKPSYESCYLPFNSIHPFHMKKNIPFAMLLRAPRYCSSFQLHLNERESLWMSLLLNKYPNDLTEKQFIAVLEKFNISVQIPSLNYEHIRTQIHSQPDHTKSPVDFEKNLFVHFTYCSNMRTFPIRFHTLWQKYFNKSPINEIRPILGTRNVKNLHLQLR